MRLTERNQRLFIKDMDTGAIFDLGDVAHIERLECEEIHTDPMLNDEFEHIYKPAVISGTFECHMDLATMQPKVKIRMFYGITNNFIRMHGGKPLRRIPKRFLK